MKKKILISMFHATIILCTLFPYTHFVSVFWLLYILVCRLVTINLWCHTTQTDSLPLTNDKGNKIRNLLLYVKDLQNLSLQYFNTPTDCRCSWADPWNFCICNVGTTISTMFSGIMRLLEIQRFTTLHMEFLLYPFLTDLVSYPDLMHKFTVRLSTLLQRIPLHGWLLHHVSPKTTTAFKERK